MNAVPPVSRSRTDRVTRALALVAPLCLVVNLATAGAHDDEPTMLFLELVVNGVAGRVVQVEQRAQHFIVAADDLRTARVTIPGNPTGRIDLDTLSDVRVVYERYAQQLLVHVPPSWLPTQQIRTARSASDLVVQHSSPGVVATYDLYQSRAIGSSTQSAWNESRLFGRWGTLSNTLLLRRVAAGSRPADTTLLRYDTTWIRVDDRRLLTYTAGDVITGALSWTRAVPLGGVTISRNFQTRPDLITYPLPEFAGAVALPSAVDLIVNGGNAAHADVEPGPFTFGALPLVNGAGTATIVTTDALGRQTPQTVKFYVAGSLLRRGFLEYSLSAGALRRQPGLRSFAYDGAAWSGSAKYGLSNRVTVQGHSEAGPGLHAEGAGSEFALGRFGVGSASAAFSGHDRDRGLQTTIGYAYTTARYSINAQQLHQSRGYADLASAAVATRPVTARRTRQLTGAVALGRTLGTLSGGYFSVIGADGTRATTANISFSRNIAGRASALLGAGWRAGRDYGWSSQAQLVLPLGGRRSAAIGAASADDGGAPLRMQVSQAAPSDGGLGWTASLDTSGRYRQADLAWRHPFVQASAGLFGQSGHTTAWTSASGSVVAMDGGVFPANRVSDSFVLVDTDRPDVPVYFEHQLMGRTDRSGHLLVPSVPANYVASYAIDTLQLPSNVDAAIVEQEIAVTRRAGAIVRFPLRTHLSAMATLVDGSGQPLPFGASVSNITTGSLAVVGWDGIVYLEDVAADNELDVRVRGAATCRARLRLAEPMDGIAQAGRLVCR